MRSARPGWRRRGRYRSPFRARRRPLGVEVVRRGISGATAGPDDRGMRAEDVLVRRDTYQNFESLAQKSVGEVKQPAHRLACAVLRWFGFSDIAVPRSIASP